MEPWSDLVKPSVAVRPGPVMMEANSFGESPDNRDKEAVDRVVLDCCNP